MSDKIGKDVAKQEFDRWVDAMRIDLDTDGMDENDRADFAAFERSIVKYIGKGIASVDTEGLLQFNPMPGKNGHDFGNVVFRPPTGASYLAMDLKKAHANIGKIFASLADITEISQAHYSKMAAPDIKFCIAVFSLFFG